MNLNAIKKKIRDEGLMKSAGYYSNRVISKLSMHVVGRLAAWHGQAKKNRIVFKNREMLDFTDNPRALFEYLEEKGYNEKYQIIYMVSEKKNFRSRHYKNVKFVTAESPGGFSSPAAFASFTNLASRSASPVTKGTFIRERSSFTTVPLKSLL